MSKKVLLSFIFVQSFVLTMFCFGNVGAGVLGDVNDDQQIDLVEAVYSLQVASGVKPVIQSPVYKWGGNWQVDIGYKENHLVLHDNIIFKCILSHTSSYDNAPPYKGNWIIMAETDRPEN